VHTADDGTAAVDYIAGKNVAPDVILMDAQMPGLHGTALIAELRSRSRARIIAVSGSAPPAEVSAAADGWLLKPLEIAALRQILDGRSALLETASSPAGDGEPPMVSAEVLAKLRHLMPESSVREIYKAIVADLSRRAQILEIAMAKGDVAEVRRIGHAVKGGCAMAGAMQAARVGAELEAYSFELAGNQSDDSTRLLSDLRSAAQNLERILKGELPA
jgi:two-component system sensor histidine kinase/response regulator